MKPLATIVRTLIAVAAIWSPEAAYAGKSDHLAVRGRTAIDQGVFEFDVTMVGQAGTNIYVHCVSDCDGRMDAYRENSGLTPLYVMVPKEGSSRFISVWMSASAYWVMVHQVGYRTIVKVFEDGARVPPVVSLDEQGNERITLCDRDKVCRVVRWEADRYVVEKKIKPDR